MCGVFGTKRYLGHPNSRTPVLRAGGSCFLHPVLVSMEITSPNSIQPREYSRGSGIGGHRHNCSRLRDSGNRLNLGNFNRDGLNCDNWSWNDANSDIGCLALMV